MAESTCPEKQILLDFAAGLGDASLRSSVLGHLARCPRCRGVVSGIADHTTEAGPGAIEIHAEPLLASGSHLGCDGAQRDLEDESTALCPTPEEVQSRFDFRLLELPRKPSVLGHLGKYEVLQVLGYGGMGIVFRAQDEQLLRVVAIKVMSRELASSPTARRRFIREARAAAAINHPNVVTIHAVEEHNGTPFLVMEFIEGESLRDRLRHGPRMEIVDVLRIAAQVATGLAAAHSHGVIHRDIKPGNIMLQDALQRVKITDFGLARVTVDNSDLTSHHIGVGTPAYMSPEQVRGDEIDARSDLFALGCVMYAMLRGHSPFHGRTTLEVARKVADGEPNPAVADPSIPTFLSEIIERLLQKLPDQRYQSAGEVAEVLRRHLAIVNQTPTDKINQVLQQGAGATAPRAKRSVLPFPITALAGLAVITALAGWQFGLFHAPPASAVKRTPPDPGVVPQAPPALTVSKNGDADYGTLTEALRQVTPGGKVTVLDDAEYIEAIRLTDSTRFAGVQLLSPLGATLSASGQGTVVTLGAIPRFRLEGFKIVASQVQVGIEINGPCPGLVLENLSLERTPNSDGSALSNAAIAIRSGASGTSQEPIVVRRVSLQDTNVGFAIANRGAQDPSTGHIVLEENTVFGLSREPMGGSTLLAIVRRCEDLVIRRNIFAHGTTGLSILTEEEAHAVRCRLEHNTWHDVQNWINWTGPMRSPLELALHHNLVVDAGGIAQSARPLASVTSPEPLFVNNVVVNANSSSESFTPFATEIPPFPLLSQETNHPDYLKPDIPRLRAAGLTLDPIPGRYSGSDAPPR